MVPPDLQQLVENVVFRNPQRALARLGELGEKPGEQLALVQLVDVLRVALQEAADPDAGLHHFSRFVHAHGARWQLYRLLKDHPAALDTLVRVVASSNYLADILVRNPEYFDFVSNHGLLQPRTLAESAAELSRTWSAFRSRFSQFDAVRRFRRREILRIGIADVIGRYSLPLVTDQLSVLADNVVSQCLKIIENGEPSRLFVLALGKLGGHELNYSSDIDLVFVSSSDQVEAATQTAMQLNKVLGDATSEGFMYRVDLRLRPYGASGALVVSSEMLTKYLAETAFPAERQAMLKVRVIAGDVRAGAEWFDDVSAILHQDADRIRAQVRGLKDRIEREQLTKTSCYENVKIGPGRIRDAEFVVQALQIENLRAHETLRNGNTLQAIEHLQRLQLLSDQEAKPLANAYEFLRNVEHRLQLMDNRQVHAIPSDPTTRTVLARSVGCGGADPADAFQQQLEAATATIRTIFERVLPRIG